MLEKHLIQCLSHKNHSINVGVHVIFRKMKEIAIINKYKAEIQQLKNAIWLLKNVSESLTSQIDQTEELVNLKTDYQRYHSQEGEKNKE